MFVRRWKWCREINMTLFLPLLSCESSMCKKENPDKKKSYREDFASVSFMFEVIVLVNAKKKAHSSSALVIEEMMIPHVKIKND